MKHTKCALFIIALFGMVNFIVANDAFQPQIIKGRIIEKRTGSPASNAILQICYFSEVAAGQKRMVSNDYYSCSDNGEFAITNLSDQVSRCDIELADNNKYQESLISGPFEPGVNNWGTFRVALRPFYFKTCLQQENVVSATIVNTTGKKAYMRFWLTGQLTRLDDSEYLGCNSKIPLQLKQGKKACEDYATYQLIPGENNIRLRIRDYGPYLSISDIMISGGRSYLEPMMPSTRVIQMIVLPPVTNTLPPIHITNFPPVLTNFPTPILITNFPPISFPTNWPPVRTNFPPYTTPFGSEGSVSLMASWVLPRY